MQYFEISALDLAQVNDVVQSAIQEICKKIASNYYGSLDVKQYEKHGIRTIGEAKKISLTGIIDYDHQLEVPECPNILEPSMPVIGEAELDQEEEDIEDWKGGKQQDTNRKVKEKKEEQPSQEVQEEKEN